LSPRSEQRLKLSQRNDGEFVLRAAQSGPALGADADDAEVDALDLDELVEGIEIAEQAVGRLPTDHRDRTVRVDLGRAHQPAAFGVETGEVDVFRRDPADLRLIDGLVAIRDTAAGARIGHDRGHQVAVAADGTGVLQREARVVPDLVPLVVAARDRKLLDVEGVGASLIEDGALDRRIQALDQRHHRDDRGHRDDVAEHRHQRPELGRPDCRERDEGGFDELVHGCDLHRLVGRVGLVGQVGLVGRVGLPGQVGKAQAY
jgi:hypothetical protein